MRLQGSKNLFRSFARVCRGVNGASDHQPIRADRKRLFWSQSSFLIICGCALGPDAGSDKLKIVVNNRAQVGHFQRRAHQASQARLRRQSRQPLHLPAHVRLKSDLTQGLIVEAGQDRDAQNKRWRSA